MKMITMTRKTSVSGVMLISAKIESPPSSSPSPLTSGCFPIAIVSALRALGFGLGVGLHVVAVLLGLARRGALGRRVEQELEELVGEELHLGRDPVRALAEEV